MKETDIAVCRRADDVCLVLTTNNSGYGRGKEQTCVLLNRDEATALRDQIDAALRL